MEGRRRINNLDFVMDSLSYVITYSLISNSAATEAIWSLSD